MRSATRDGRPLKDLTARARIRDAALEQFAEHGFEGATIRSIAEAAGVSPGLVQHHFGSKEGLRQACDEAVLELVRRKLRATRDGQISNPSFVSTLYEAGRPLVPYLARAAVDRSSPATAALLDEIVEGAEAFLTTTWPERFPQGSRRTRDAAAVLVAQSAGTLVLYEHLARQMGLEANGALSPRIGLAQFDVYEALGEYVASDLGQRIREAAMRYAAETEEV